MIPHLTETRKDRLLHERVHDPYKLSGKPLEPSVCPVCRAVFKHGRWQWSEFWPQDAHQETCQACQRIRDHYPAGFLTLSGAFLKTHREGLFNLVRHQELCERTRHPLHRILSVEERPNQIVVTTTDIHLPKRLARAIQSAYKGRLTLHYDQGGCFVRANWIADERQDSKQIAMKRTSPERRPDHEN